MRLEILWCIVILVGLSLGSGCELGSKDKDANTDTSGTGETVGQEVIQDIFGSEDLSTDIPEDPPDLDQDLGLDSFLPDGAEEVQGDGGSEDWGQDEENPPDLQAGCPEDFPAPGVACEGEMKCTYGEECCCGECFDSLVCQCFGGSFGCYYTDACLGGNWCAMPPCCEAGGADHCKELGNLYGCVPLGDGPTGKCLTPVPKPFCWTDAACDEGKVCQGAMICPCDADCDMEDTPGKCLPPDLPAGCCYDDSDCDTGTDAVWTCAVPASGLPGVCTYWFGDGKCWDDGDCADGETCQGAMFCPCGLGCGMPDKPGDCVGNTGGEVGDLCGQSGGDCKPGLVCCYPCGIPDCNWQCAYPCQDNETWCFDGCPMYP